MPRSSVFLLSYVATALLASMVPARAQNRLAVASAAKETIVSLSESVGDVDNPERGFSVPVGLTGRPLHNIRDERGVSLLRIDGRLDSWREQDLPGTFLESVDARLAEARAAGLKVVLRFMYNEGPFPDSRPDASLAWIKRHIAQLKPVLQKHGPVIAWMEAGFVGAWGEWHSSTHGLDRDMDAKRAVINALLDALPQPRSILLRYPSDIAALYGTSFSDREAFGHSAKSRIGHHNDCFLASETDSGTYGREDRSIAAEKSMVSSYGKHTPVGGETCQVNHPRSDCTSALAELQRLGFSELNLGYHPGVLDSWRSGGCFDTIKARFGYRLWIERARLPTTVTAGADARITISLRNSGFAPPLSPRPVYLVLDGPVRRMFKLPHDPRSWAAGRAHAIDIEAEVPADLPPGSYRVSLWLPDASQALRADPRYAIRLANDGTWDSRTGFNRLPDFIVVRAAPQVATVPSGRARPPLSEPAMGLGARPN
jgi:hypothetical protein